MSRFIEIQGLIINIDLITCVSYNEETNKTTISFPHQHSGIHVTEDVRKEIMELSQGQ